MIEVEVKAKIDNFEDMEKKLLKINATKTKRQLQEDIYFNSPTVDFSKTDEALRIRTTRDDDGENIFITYKGPKLNSESKTRKEIEIGVEDSEKLAEILIHLGFKKVRTVKKTRQYWQYRNFEISLDDVEGLNPYMEIEISLDDGSDYNQSQNEIFELFKKLGVEDGFEKTSYLELLEKLY